MRQATRWARAIRMLDPGAKLVSCGMNGWNDWDRVAEGEMLAMPVANGIAVTLPRALVRGGSRAVFEVHVEALHVFDPDTHRAIGSAGR